MDITINISDANMQRLIGAALMMVIAVSIQKIIGHISKGRHVDTTIEITRGDK